jgi:hypothetical protein
MIMKFEEKAEIVISQLRVDRDRLQNIIEQIRAEIDRQEKWLLQAGYTAYNVDIAFDTIKAVLAESEVEE